jgi:hypothetical protein
MRSCSDFHHPIGSNFEPIGSNLKETVGPTMIKQTAGRAGWLNTESTGDTRRLFLELGRERTADHLFVAGTFL